MQLSCIFQIILSWKIFAKKHLFLGETQLDLKTKKKKKYFKIFANKDLFHPSLFEVEEQN